MTTVLEYLLGAGILGVLVTQIATWVRAELERRRERNGLLRILFTEVSSHRGPIKSLCFFFEQAKQGDPKAEKHSRSAPPVFFESMETETWQDTRVKLAQDLSSQEFASLASYYRVLLSGKEIAAKDMESPDTYRTVRFAVNRLHELGQEVDQVIHAHVPDLVEDELTDEDLSRLDYTEDL